VLSQPLDIPISVAVTEPQPYSFESRTTPDHGDDLAASSKATTPITTFILTMH